MAKFYGEIGYGIQTEIKSGVWDEVIETRNYYGDVIENTFRPSQGDGVVDDISISNKISIVADTFAYQHFYAIRYVVWLGAKWKVTNVSVQSPRLILSIGGVYNGSGGPQAGVSESS